MQVKTGHAQNGVITFRGTSQHTNAEGNSYKQYEDDIDYFIVYCHDNDKLYLVEEAGFYNMNLRFDEPEQVHESINWASDFEFDERWPPSEDDLDRSDGVARTVRDLRERGVRVFEAGEEVPYDVLLEQPSGEFERTSVRPGSVVNGRIRFDTGRARAPGPGDVDLVVVACEELKELYLIQRTEYEKSISLRVEEPAQSHPGTNRAEAFEFDDRWPPDAA